MGRRRRSRGVFGPDPRADVEHELSFHLEMRIRDLVDRGETPERARELVRQRFGSYEDARQACIAIDQRQRSRIRISQYLRELAQDVRYGTRLLWRAPAFTAAAVVSLVLGIATSTGVVSLIDAALFRPLPFEEPDRLTLVNITQHTPAAGLIRHRWSWPRFQLLERDGQSFEAVGSASNVVVTLTGAGDPLPLPIEVVSPQYMRTMRAPVALGTGLHERRDRSSDDPVVLGFDLWQRVFGGSPDVLGRRVTLNGVPLSVVGVTGRGFAGVSGLAQAWIPAAVAPAITYPAYLTSNENFLTVVGRLRQGVDTASALAELEVLGERIHAAAPSEADSPQDRFSATLVPLATARADEVTRRALLLTGGAAAVLLLMACANVASLLLGRAAARRREIAIRLAVGASRVRLVRQLLVESSVLAAIAAVPALVGAAWMLAVVRMPVTLARGRNFYGAVGEFATPVMDLRVVAAAVVIAATTVLVAGLAPALRATRRDVVTDLKAGAGGARRGWGLREGAVALQIGAAMVLLAGCGLLLTSYVRLRDAPIGFEAAGLLTFMLRPSEAQYPPPAAPALWDRVLEAIARVPGVSAVTIDGCAPLTMQCARASLEIVGRPSRRAADAPIVRRHYVAPTHFETLRVPLVAGRGLMASDRAGSPPVVVINEAAVRRFWPGENPIGRRIWFDGAPVAGSADTSAEIVGVVADVAYEPLEEQPIQPDFFTPYAQFTYVHRMVLVRVEGDPLAHVTPIAQAVRRAGPNLALFDVQSMEARAGLSRAKQATQTMLFGVIAAMALGLVVAGVFGVTAFYVTSRLRDIGVRMTLGASAAAIATVTLAQTARLGLTGLAIGLAGALWLSRLLGASLYQTNPLTAGVYLGAGAVLIAALALGTYVPVRRAMRVNPIDVLRHE